MTLTRQTHYEMDYTEPEWTDERFHQDFWGRRNEYCANGEPYYEPAPWTRGEPTHANPKLAFLDSVKWAFDQPMTEEEIERRVLAAHVEANEKWQRFLAEKEATR